MALVLLLSALSLASTMDVEHARHIRAVASRAAHSVAAIFEHGRPAVVLAAFAADAAGLLPTAVAPVYAAAALARGPLRRTLLAAAVAMSFASFASAAPTSTSTTTGASRAFVISKLVDFEAFDDFDFEFRNSLRSHAASCYQLRSGAWQKPAALSLQAAIASVLAVPAAVVLTAATAHAPTPPPAAPPSSAAPAAPPPAAPPPAASTRAAANTSAAAATPPVAVPPVLAAPPAPASVPALAPAAPNLPDRDGDGNLLVCKLKKSLYGLKQAAREWAHLLDRRLQEFGFRRSIIDTCVYRLHEPNSNTELIALTYVDDIICAYNNAAAKDKFVAYMKTVFPLDDRGELSWMLRMQIIRHPSANSQQPPNTPGTIILSQQQYATRIAEKFHPTVASAPATATPMADDIDLVATPTPDTASSEHAVMASKRATYMSAVGALLWLASGTRPDLSYTVAVLASYCSNPGDGHYSLKSGIKKAGILRARTVS